MAESAEDILDQIKRAAANDPGGKNIGTNQTIYHSCRLSVLLNEQATRNAEKNLKLSKSVNCLTWVIVALTVIITLLGIAQANYARLAYNLSASQQNPSSQTDGSGAKQ